MLSSRLSKISQSTYRTFAASQKRWPTPITQLFIDGEFVNATNGKTFETVDPRTEQVICTMQAADSHDVDKAVLAATNAFADGSEWREMTGGTRRDIMLKIADVMEKNREELAYYESMDNGKPVNIANNVDIEKCIRCYRYYAGWADKCRDGTTIAMEENPGMFAYTVNEPVGVVGQIIPWNFPLLMQAWKIGPALATGCTVVMKTSEKTPITNTLMADVFREAGLPKGVVNILNGFGPDAGEPLARHNGVDKVAFTGSTAVGKKIQMIAGETNLKNVTLELGGKSPQIVCEDADLDKALNAAQIGLFLNAGQCCIASSRLFVQDTIYDKFVKKVVDYNKSGKAAWTIDTGMQGPQVDKIQFDKVMALIKIGKEEGANCALGGERHGDKGYYIQPTVFTDVNDDMTIMKEEIFGPVMSIAKFSTLEEAIERANNTHYGLGAGIITENVGQAHKLAGKIRAGTVYVNCYDVFDVNAPFGGFKQSGIGRELGPLAIRNYLESKTVIIPMN